MCGDRCISLNRLIKSLNVVMFTWTAMHSHVHKGALCPPEATSQEWILFAVHASCPTTVSLTPTPPLLILTRLPSLAGDAPCWQFLQTPVPSTFCTLLCPAMFTLKLLCRLVHWLMLCFFPFLFFSFTNTPFNFAFPISHLHDFIFSHHEMPVAYFGLVSIDFFFPCLFF